MEPYPLISVVMPTYRRLHLLREALLAVQKQDYPHYEVIVVDDCSLDGTEAYLQRLARNGPALRFHTRASRGGPAAARNDGLRLARGTWVAFTDDDCRPQADWLSRLWQAVGPLEETVGGAGGAVRPLVPDTILGRYVRASSRHRGNLDGDKVFFLDTANAMYRRVVLEEVGGFDPGVCFPWAEDVDLSIRVKAAGWTLHYAPAAVVWHVEPQSLSGYLGQPFRHGRGIGILRHKHPAMFAGPASRGAPRLVKRFLARWKEWGNRIGHPAWRRRALRCPFGVEASLRAVIGLVRFLGQWFSVQRTYRGHGLAPAVLYTALTFVDRVAYAWGEVAGTVSFAGGEAQRAAMPLDQSTCSNRSRGASSPGDCGGRG